MQSVKLRHLYGFAEKFRYQQDFLCEPYFYKILKGKETKEYFSFETLFLPSRDHYKQVSSSFFHF